MEFSFVLRRSTYPKRPGKAPIESLLGAFELKTKRHVAVATDDLLNAVKARAKKNFTNKFTQLIDFFDGSTKEKIEYNNVAADIGQYYLDRGTEVEKSLRETLLMCNGSAVASSFLLRRSG